MGEVGLEASSLGVTSCLLPGRGSPGVGRRKLPHAPHSWQWVHTDLKATHTPFEDAVWR